jgi:hypothetical protein
MAAIRSAIVWSAAAVLLAQAAGYAQGTSVSSTVKGKVEGMANWSPGIRVMISGDRTAFRREAFPKPDGTFQFENVPVDTYEVRFMPKVSGTLTKTIAVTGRGDVSVTLLIPAQQNVALRIATREGPLPSNLSLGLRLSQTEAYTVVFPSAFVLQNSASTEGTLGRPTVVSASKSDGRYTLRMPEGEYRVEVSTPEGYEVISILAGETDLRQAPLRVGPGISQEIDVRLKLR